MEMYSMWGDKELHLTTKDDDLKHIGNKDTPKPIKRFLNKQLDTISTEQTEWELAYLEAISNLMGVHDEGECVQCPFDDSHESGYQHEMFSGTEYYLVPGCKLKTCWITTAKKFMKKYNPKEPEHPDKVKEKREKELERARKGLIQEPNK